MTGDGTHVKHDGVYDASDAYVGNTGHYYMGEGRRRVGGGFAHVSLVPSPTPPPTVESAAHFKQREQQALERINKVKEEVANEAAPSGATPYKAPGDDDSP